MPSDYWRTVSPHLRRAFDAAGRSVQLRDDGNASGCLEFEAYAWQHLCRAEREERKRYKAALEGIAGSSVDYYGDGHTQAERLIEAATDALENAP